jgi:His/Glu/Gln/Arg/opine family amino acid ABC transporter permease subunit
MELLLRNLPFIMQGIGMTLTLALATLFFSTLIAFALGTLATLRFRWLRVAVKFYVELFRDIPLIVNIFFVFFVAPLFGIELSPFAAVTVGLSLWGSANGTEIVRAGFNSVPAHQWQSAGALGLKGWEVYLFAPYTSRTGHLARRTRRCDRVLQSGPDHRRTNDHDGRLESGLHRLWRGAVHLLPDLLGSDMVRPMARTQAEGRSKARGAWQWHGRAAGYPTTLNSLISRLPETRLWNPKSAVA